MTLPSWPAWRFGLGPDGAVQQRIFARPEDVPAGWVDSPAKLAAPAQPAQPQTKGRRRADRP